MELAFIASEGGILLLALMIVILVSFVVWSLHNGISPMPTSPKAKAGLLSLLPSDLQGNICELGSGWGTLLFPLARRYPGCQVIGFETSPLPFWISRLWLNILKLPNAKLVQQDFFRVNLSKASLVVCYLYPGAMKKLKTKFEAELKLGTFVISNTFSIPEWTPEVVFEVDDLYHSKIYLYRVQSKKFRHSDFENRLLAHKSSDRRF